MDTLLSTASLATRLGDAALCIVDASFKMPGVSPTARESYTQAHIPGAVFFDIDEIADRKTPLPHMLPTPEVFAQKVQALGLGNEHTLVLYDQNGIAGAARAWWMFRVFGHTRCAVLDGGLRRWMAEDRAVDASPVTPGAARFTARFDSSLVRARDQVLENVASRREQVLDARSPERFAGAASEPWPGRRPGRIPGSFNLDHASLMNEDGTLKAPAELRTLLDASGATFDKPFVTSCGSGITACVLAFALHRLGHARTAVYDGSWAEWGLEKDLPIETGPR